MCRLYLCSKKHLLGFGGCLVHFCSISCSDLFYLVLWSLSRFFVLNCLLNILWQIMSEIPVECLFGESRKGGGAGACCLHLLHVFKLHSLPDMSLQFMSRYPWFLFPFILGIFYPWYEFVLIRLPSRGYFFSLCLFFFSIMGKIGQKKREREKFEAFGAQF